MREYNSELKEASRELRKHQTKAEKRLWMRIRGKQLNGHLFTRQKPLEEIIVDFYCHKAKLVLEIDGARHFSTEGKHNDLGRDEHLKNLGLTVLRFTNSQILNHIESVIERIKTCL